MLAMRLRVRPCSARCSLSSDGRWTVTAPSTMATVIAGCTAIVRAPFEPFPETCCPETLTSTPEGIATGCRPILLISSSPHVSQYFAADARLDGLPVGDEPLRRRDDRYAQAAEHARDGVPLRVDA